MILLFFSLLQHVRLSKMDKADILEMAVEYVKKTREQGEDENEGNVSTVIVDRYRAGFNACADVLQSHLDQLPQITNDCRARLMDHLANFIQNKQWFAEHLQNACLPLQFCEQMEQVRTSTTRSDASHTESLVTQRTSPVNYHSVSSPSIHISSSNRLSLGSDILSPRSDGMLSTESDRLSTGSSRLSSRSSFGSDVSSRLSLSSGFTSPDLDWRSNSGRHSSDRLSTGSDGSSLFEHQTETLSSLSSGMNFENNRYQHSTSGSGSSHTFVPSHLIPHTSTVTSSKTSLPLDHDEPIDLSKSRHALRDTKCQFKMRTLTNEHELHTNITQRKRLKTSMEQYKTLHSSCEEGTRKLPQNRVHGVSDYQSLEHNKENNMLVVHPNNVNLDIDYEDDESMWRPW